MRLVVITGPSGAGKTAALHSLEDAGYYSMDNLPCVLLPEFASFCEKSDIVLAALVVDTRSGESFRQLSDIVAEMKSAGTPVEILYLDASDNALLQRYKETRRPHPLRKSQADGETEGGIMQVIKAERGLLDAARALADNIVDTSSFSASTLRETIQAKYAGNSRPALLLTVISFGFKYGLPVDADLVFDVRFLANPHYIAELRELDGRNSLVANYVNADPNAAPFKQKMLDLILFCLPQYMREGKAYLNIAIGCTGGQHRSVTISEELTATLKKEGYSVSLQHRDVGSHKRLDPE